MLRTAEERRAQRQASQAAYYLANRPYALAYQQGYDAAHGEQIAAYQADYREAHRWPHPPLHRDWRARQAARRRRRLCTHAERMRRRRRGRTKGTP